MRWDDTDRIVNKTKRIPLTLNGVHFVRDDIKSVHLSRSLASVADVDPVPHQRHVGAEAVRAGDGLDSQLGLGYVYRLPAQGLVAEGRLEAFVLTCRVLG